METLAESTWDVIICGTGLQQSLLALSLSRSGKKILHIDPNNYYGGPDAALSLQDVEDWAHQHSFTTAVTNSESSKLFSSIVITKPDDAETSALSFPRAYSLALAPQFIHTRSALLAQLVASRAYKQIEFQAVGSFFVFQAAKASSTSSPQLARVPSTREDVFSTTAIPARSKRQLMKFLKFVFDFQDEEQKATWEDHKDDQLEAFLKDKFGLDEQLRTYILALTLARDSTAVKVEQGLETIHRHIRSTGMFGPGFAAVYPKWGGAGEIAQIACRACAVGGGVYVLGTGAKSFEPATPTVVGETETEVEVELSNHIVVKTKLFIRDSEEDAAEGSETVSIMVAIIASPMASLFEITVEGAPTPAVAVVVFPQGSQGPDSSVLKYPVFAAVHSSDTGECPAGQSVIYLSTTAYPGSQSILSWALDSLLSATVGPPIEGDAAKANAPKCLYKVCYEQVARTASSELRVNGKIVAFPPSSASLAFDDGMLAGVRRAWDLVMGPAGLEGGIEYMVFPDREEMGDDEDAYP